jgi:hypothetical protein
MYVEAHPILSPCLTHNVVIYNMMKKCFWFTNHPSGALVSAGLLLALAHAGVKPNPETTQ